MAPATTTMPVQALALKPDGKQLAPQPIARPALIARPPVAKKSPPALSPLPAQAPSPKNLAPSPVQYGSPRTAPPPVKPSFPLQDSQVTQLSTSKVWVLPPRPKPGRKPSTDTPPTKRKAQNRAAQRAFRERRAARVSELEEMLSDVNAERDMREQQLNEKLNSMSQENFELRNSLEELRRDLRLLQSSSRSSYQVSEVGTPRIDNAPSPFSTSSPQTTTQTSTGGYPPSMNQMASPAPSMESPMDVLDRVLELRLPVPEPIVEAPKETSNYEDDDCGVCTKEDCICESLGIREPKPKPSTSSSSAPVETNGAVQLKRRQATQGRNLNPFKKLKKTDEAEVDFTAEFAKPKPPKPVQQVQQVQHVQHVQHIQPVVAQHSHEPQQVLSNSGTPVDKCGFCSDGTPCLCAEAAADEASNMAELQDNTLPPLVMSPHPSTPTLTPLSHSGSSVKLPSLQSGLLGPAEISTPKSGCTGNPGTCSQCQADPMSTLFCTTLANRESETKAADKGGCCGGSKSGGGCCKDKAATPQAPGTFIPCSAAYQTLSRHKDFKRVDLGQLVGKLNTRGMQVEVSSVANVLRELDRRLYQ